ncbi:hypothetical protein RUM44_001371 [Polyplax serrata]|uniref:Uncharacterized protein n=1 Tax=Polyplax serrata TaxID=468196 RepID=A0ABR1ALC6_POLSC
MKKDGSACFLALCSGEATEANAFEYPASGPRGPPSQLRPILQFIVFLVVMRKFLDFLTFTQIIRPWRNTRFSSTPALKVKIPRCVVGYRDEGPGAVERGIPVGENSSKLTKNLIVGMETHRHTDTNTQHTKSNDKFLGLQRVPL